MQAAAAQARPSCERADPYGSGTCSGGTACRGSAYKSVRPSGSGACRLSRLRQILERIVSSRRVGAASRLRSRPHPRRRLQAPRRTTQIRANGRLNPSQRRGNLLEETAESHFPPGIVPHTLSRLQRARHRHVLPRAVAPASAARKVSTKSSPGRASSHLNESGDGTDCSTTMRCLIGFEPVVLTVVVEAPNSARLANSLAKTSVRLQSEAR